MSGDLAARVAALADEWERDEAYACRNASECVRCVSFQRAVIRLRDLLAVPQPEPVANREGVERWHRLAAQARNEITDASISPLSLSPANSCACCASEQAREWAWTEVRRQADAAIAALSPSAADAPDEAERCHPECSLGAADHPGYLGYRCIDEHGETLPFPGEPDRRPAAPDAQTIEDVLAAHGAFGFACACGWEDRTATYASAHRAHVAAALAAAGLLATDGKAE